MVKDQHGMVNHFRHLVMGPKTMLEDLDCVSNSFSVNQASEGSESHAEKRQKLKLNRALFYWELGERKILRKFSSA